MYAKRNGGLPASPVAAVPLFGAAPAISTIWKECGGKSPLAIAAPAVAAATAIAGHFADPRQFSPQEAA